MVPATAAASLKGSMTKVSAARYVLLITAGALGSATLGLLGGFLLVVGLWFAMLAAGVYR